MREIRFSELYAADFDVSRPLAINHNWNEKKEFEMKQPRKNSAFLYFENCDGEYIFPDGTKLQVEKGDVVYIPQNSFYKTIFYQKNEEIAHTMLIEFETKDKHGSFCISNNVFVAAKDENLKYFNIFSEAADIFSMPFFPVSALKSLLFNLLFTIASGYRNSDRFSNEFKKISDAVKYIEMNSNIEKSVSELADMCYMSETYFRQLFKKSLGVSPMEYCISLKISNAKRFLKSGFYSVEEVSDMLGFKDSGYFNKVFKKYTGVTPGKYRRSSH